MKKFIRNNKKYIFSLLIIIIFTIGIVPKTFQNDTFFNISIGKYILKNGIDMKEHFSWNEGLTYTYSHWIFDIITFLIYNFFDLDGIYVFTIIMACIINYTLYFLLEKRYGSNIISLLLVLSFSYLIRSCFTARSQIISFLFFIIELYSIEQFIDTNKKRYAIYVIISSIIIANFHAASWPLTILIFMPYLGCIFLNFIKLKNIYRIKANYYLNKLNKLSTESKKYFKIKEKYECFLEKSNKDYEPIYNKIESKTSYNDKNLIILFIIVLFTGLITPIKLVPYTYIINSMFGKSNLPLGSSMDYISEMQPTIVISNFPFLTFTILIVAFIAFVPIKLKKEHGLLLGLLYLMSLSSVRYTYFLVMFGLFPLCDLITRMTNLTIHDDIEKLEKLYIKNISFILIIFLVLISTTSKFLEKTNISYLDETFYPVGATEYIVKNLDYKNIRIYNSYNVGSYLMFHNIPVFIDSRLDVYCSEFNKNSEIFKDYVSMEHGTEHYDDIVSKYNFTHILLSKNNTVSIYMQRDNKYKEIYSDDNFILFEKL